MEIGMEYYLELLEEGQMGPELDPSWFADEFDYPEEPKEDVPSLIDLCAKKLTSDVCLLKDVSLFPQPLINILLIKALEQKRPLSVIQLLKYYPYTEFVLTMPPCLRSWNKLFCMNSDEINLEIRDLRHRGWMIFNGICKLVYQENKTSNLCMIDLGDYLMESDLGKVVCAMILQSGRKPEEMKQRYLKMGFTLVKNHDALMLTKLKRDCKLSGIHVSVTGLNFYNNMFTDSVIMQLLDQLETSELRLFSMHFAEVSPTFRKTLTCVRKFENLKLLNLSYARVDFNSDFDILQVVSCTLYELVHLSHLSITNAGLTGCVPALLRKNCIQPGENFKKQKTDSPLKCCLLHRGTLQYLDFSSCNLTRQDLMCLKTSPLTETLKYLNISYNKFDLLSMSLFLEAMQESLVMLYMEHCLPENALSRAPSIKFSKMAKLQCISMLGLDGSMLEMELLANELKKMPNLKKVYLSVPYNWYFPTCHEDNIKKIEGLIAGQNCIKTTWKYHSFFRH